jgi:pyrroline-5-carboxylate reductase
MKIAASKIAVSKITFVGGGNMATALIGGLVAKGADARSISVIELSPAAREALAARYPVHISTAPDAAMQGADTLVLAVKPQDMRAALSQLSTNLDKKLVISIAAGITLEALSRWLGGHRKLVRCMPNTPALIGAGITGLYAFAEVAPDERKKAETIMSAVGDVVWLAEERLLDPVTAVSGSGPAYVYWFIEQLASSAESLGIPRETALKLAMKTVLGAAQLAATRLGRAAELRKQVTSKGGTTEAALKVFDEEKLAERFARAIAAASRRGEELGKEQGKD